MLKLKMAPFRPQRVNRLQRHCRPTVYGKCKEQRLSVSRWRTSQSPQLWQEASATRCSASLLSMGGTGSSSLLYDLHTMALASHGDVARPELSIMRHDAHFAWQCHFEESSGVPHAGMSFLAGTSPSKGQCGQRFVHMCRCTVAILQVRRVICSTRGAGKWRSGRREACVQENSVREDREACEVDSGYNQQQISQTP